MADIQSPWTNPPVPNQDLGGDLATQRGGDPNASVDGSSGLQPIWDEKFVPEPPAKETANSVSGLPPHPDRYEPSGEPPPPPNLTDRTPGTIDEQ